VNIALWIVSAVLATAFLFAGGSKLAKPKEALAQQGMAYVEDFPAGTIKLIGASEVLGALGLILPWATGVATVLTPLAATGLVIIMVGAVITHLRRKEPKVIGANIVLLVLAAFVAIGRFAG
jgi:uncharacterized membrane protein YphA (DoxX/SURF4 family)